MVNNPFIWTLLLPLLHLFFLSGSPALAQPETPGIAHPLEGKRIIIDPGHGGDYHGAVGKGGLKESEANLAVALHLWGKLKSDGADVQLSRTADGGPLAGETGDLRDDLKARADISYRPPAHLFISIHHNSDTYHPEKDQSEVYYRLSDPNPSLDFAKELQKEFQSRFGLARNILLAGNYRVLRLSAGAAVLGEACYLSNEKCEERLRTLSALREEAEAYYSAIVNYFRKGQPEIFGLYPDLVVLSRARPTLEAFLRDSEGGTGIDPSTILLTVDGRVVEHAFDPRSGKLTHHPPVPLPNGLHSFRVEARNLLGNAALSREATFSPMALNTSTITLLSLANEYEIIVAGLNGLG